MEKGFNDYLGNENDKIEVKAQVSSKKIIFFFFFSKEIDSQKKYKLKKFLWLFATLVLLLIVFLTSLFFSYFGKDNLNLNFLFGKNKEIIGSPEVNSDVTVVTSSPKKGDELTAPSIYEKVSPAIVGVITSNKEMGLGNAVGQGTGIVMTSDGYILTNAHVIGFSKNNNVTIALDEKEYAAKIIGFDARVDIAVLKIDAKNLKKAEFGNLLVSRNR